MYVFLLFPRIKTVSPEKSTLLFAIDFCFGGESYLEQKFPENLKNQTFKFIFEFIPPNQISETPGMNYLMHLFKRPNPLYKKTVIKILKQAVDNRVNFGHRDFEWNTVFNWLIVGNGYRDAIADLYPYFKEEDLEEVANKDGLTCIDLLTALISFCNLNIKDPDLNEEVEELNALLEKYENTDNKGLIVSLLLEHKKNQNKEYFTFRDKLEIDWGMEDFEDYTIIEEKEEAKIGSYKRKVRKK